MRWLALLAALPPGACNYFLLAAACRRLVRGRKSGALLLLTALLIPAAALVLCAFLVPAALPWLGCGCAGVPALLALAHFFRQRLRPGEPPGASREN
ncbi:MAG: hypothetical protein LBJ11_06875 [Oscillospiraceae bacterium]|nr:hypothetical protein [Oscillospiraceae bacterium]